MAISVIERCVKNIKLKILLGYNFKSMDAINGIHKSINNGESL